MLEAPDRPELVAAAGSLGRLMMPLSGLARAVPKKTSWTRLNFMMFVSGHCGVCGNDVF